MAVNDHIRDGGETLRDLPFIITSGYTTVGNFAKVGDIWGIIYGAEDCYGTKTLTVGKSGSIHYYCERIKIPKASASAGEAIAVGKKLYFSTVDENVSVNQGGNYTHYCGICRKAALTTDTKVQADIDMRFVGLTAA